MVEKRRVIIGAKDGKRRVSSTVGVVDLCYF